MLPDYERLREITTRFGLTLLFTVFEELSGYDILRIIGAEGRT